MLDPTPEQRRMLEGRNRPMDSSIRFEFIPSNGIRLHTGLAGPENGDPVILLHGFPDAWFGWEPPFCCPSSRKFSEIGSSANNIREGVTMVETTTHAFPLGRSHYSP